MNKKEYEKVYKYLLKDCPDLEGRFAKDGKGRFTGKFLTNGKCKLLEINEVFGTKIQCSDYDVVANGEGNEEDKIDTVYSSSLQSLLAFYNVGDDNPIKIDVDGKSYSFNKVLFEYENPVIGYPSSVDVVLLNEEKGDIAFIESKCLEVIRDSSNEGKKAIGISYFHANDKSSYKQALKLNQLDLEKIGIIYPTTTKFNGREVTYDETGVYINNVSGLSKIKSAVNSVNGNSFVYSEGIKQVLSHLIGIQNFRNVSNYGYGDRIVDHKKFKTIFYIELYNAFPGLGFDKQIENFENHISTVKAVIKSKDEKDRKLVDYFISISYQELFKNNSNFKFADKDNKVKKYFHF